MAGEYARSSAGLSRAGREPNPSHLFPNYSLPNAPEFTSTVFYR